MIFQAQIGKKEEATNPFLAAPLQTSERMEGPTRGLMTYSDGAIHFSPAMGIESVFTPEICKKIRQLMEMKKAGKKLPYMKEKTGDMTFGVGTPVAYVADNSHPGQEKLIVLNFEGPHNDQPVLTVCFQMYGSYSPGDHIALDERGEKVKSIQTSPMDEKYKYLWPDTLEMFFNNRNIFSPSFFAKAGFAPGEITAALHDVKANQSASKFMARRNPDSWKPYVGALDPAAASLAKYVHMDEIGILSPDSPASAIYVSGMDQCTGVVGVVKDSKSGKVLRMGAVHIAPGGQLFLPQFSHALSDGLDKKRITVELYADLGARQDESIAAIREGMAGVKFSFKYLHYDKEGVEYHRATEMAVTREGEVLLGHTGLPLQNFESAELMTYIIKNDKLAVSTYGPEAQK